MMKGSKTVTRYNWHLLHKLKEKLVAFQYERLQVTHIAQLRKDLQNFFVEYVKMHIYRKCRDAFKVKGENPNVFRSICTWNVQFVNVV